MQPNDYIVRIGSTSAEHLKHSDAQEAIKQQNNELELTLQRLVKRIYETKHRSNFDCIEVHHRIRMTTIVN